MDQPPTLQPPVAVYQTITGTIVDGGINCPLIRLGDGRVLALQGIGRAAARIGTTFTLTGQEIGRSTCQQGPAFLVSAVLKP